MEVGILYLKDKIQSKADFEILKSHENAKYSIFPAMYYDREKDELCMKGDLAYRVIAFEDGEYVNCCDYE